MREKRVSTLLNSGERQSIQNERNQLESDEGKCEHGFYQRKVYGESSLRKRMLAGDDDGMGTVVVRIVMCAMLICSHSIKAHSGEPQQATSENIVGHTLITTCLSTRPRCVLVCICVFSFCIAPAHL